MSTVTRTQSDRLLELVRRATGRKHRSLSQAARNFGMSGGAIVRISDTQADTLIEEWSTKPAYVTAPTAHEPSGEGAMTTAQAASVLGHEVFVTTLDAPDGLTRVPDAIELLDDGTPALRARVALAGITSWSTP
jgi:hypothetical protein